MRFRVELTSEAEFDVKETYDHILRNGPGNPDDWKVGLHQKLELLEEFADWKMFAPENDYARDEICEVLYGPFRILDVLRGQFVHVVTVRHGKRRLLTSSQIDQLTAGIYDSGESSDDEEDTDES